MLNILGVIAEMFLFFILLKFLLNKNFKIYFLYKNTACKL